MLKRTVSVLTILLLLMAAVSGCSSGQRVPSYQENKKMMVDVLKTDEGKQAIKQILQDKQLKQELVFDEPAVKDTIMKALTSEQGKSMWHSLLSDPSFSKQLAKTMEKDNEAILKKLMKDPEYQSMMADILKAPNMEKQYLDLMKTQPYRKQMETVVQNTLTSPLFASQLSDSIDKAVKKQMKQESKP